VSEQRVWLITGAGRGLGVDIAKAALTAGHAVVATGRDATKVAAALGDHNNLLIVTLDVTRPHDAQAAVAAAVARFSRIDILVNNAGIFTQASSRNSAQNRSAIRSRRSCSVR
jgi:NAD(P)-dependent dehydrogenase (short-subunit alcohol dehydrogenase family)